jgi:hypothetical protein
MDYYQCYLMVSVRCFKSSEQDSLQRFTGQVLHFAFKDEDSWGDASISDASNGGVTFFFLLLQRLKANPW